LHTSNLAVAIHILELGRNFMNNLFPEATHKVLALAGRSPLDKAKGYGKLSEVVEGMLHFLLLIDEDFSFQRLCEHPRYP